MFKHTRTFIFIAVTTLLTACGGGSTSSDDQALTDAGSNAGVYMGSGSLSLRNSVTDQIVDELATEVLFSVNRNGVISFSDSSGSRGSAQLTNNLSFSFRSDARTQFEGSCQAGVIFLQGSIIDNKIEGAYRSEGIICSGTAFAVEGAVSAER